MTKSEFEALFDKCYQETVSRLSDIDDLKEWLHGEFSAKGITRDKAILAGTLLLSLEFNAALLRSVLTEVLELDG